MCYMLLRELSLVSSRAIEAYTALQAMHQKQSAEQPESSHDNPSEVEGCNASDISVDTSMQYVRPTRIPQSPDKYRRSRHAVPDEVSGLMSDFERSFASMADQWGSVLGRSVIQSSMFPRGSHPETSAATDYSLLRAGQSPINAVASSTNEGMGINDMSRLMNDSNVSTTNVSASDADLLNILERYSDRLVTLVADKIVSRQSQDKI